VYTKQKITLTMKITQKINADLPELMEWIKYDFPTDEIIEEFADRWDCSKETISKLIILCRYELSEHGQKRKKFMRTIGFEPFVNDSADKSLLRFSKN